MEDPRYSKIGKVYNGFGTFQLKSVLIKNDAGDWGTEPNENAVGIIRSTNFNNNGKLDLSDIAYRTLSPQKFEDKKSCGYEYKLIAPKTKNSIRTIELPDSLIEVVEKYKKIANNIYRKVTIPDENKQTKNKKKNNDTRF